MNNSCTTNLFISAMYDLYPEESGTSRSIDFRIRHLAKLMECDIDLVLYTSPSLTGSLPPPGLRTRIVPLPLENLRTFSSLSARHDALPPTDKPAKDTREFLALMHCKVELLNRAATLWPDFHSHIWIDGNIFKVLSRTTEAMRHVERIGMERFPQKVVAPAGRAPRLAISGFPPPAVYWRFLGGLFVVPSALQNQFNELYQFMLDQITMRGLATWEVNVLAMIEAVRPDLFELVPADHDMSMVSFSSSAT